MVLRQIFDRLAIGAVLIASAFAWEAVPVLICGLLVGGSAIPIAFRAVRDKKHGANDIEAMLDYRLTELENRIGDQLSEIEYRNSQLIESVEERIDFAEQLIAQRKERPPDDRHIGLPVVTPIKVRPLRRS